MEFQPISLNIIVKKKEGFLTYGIEKFENEYHITSDEKGEAILSNEQQKQLDKIINKMYN